LRVGGEKKTDEYLMAITEDYLSRYGGGALWEAIFLVP
jgi:hypothetical protein